MNSNKNRRKNTTHARALNITRISKYRETTQEQLLQTTESVKRIINKI